MYLIVDQKESSGLTLSAFLKQFEAICDQHLRHHKAKTFAFIFYGEEDSGVRDVLTNDKALSALNDLAGQELSVFYLLARKPSSLRRFNAAFFETLDLGPVSGVPAIVSFRIAGSTISHVQFAKLERVDTVNGLFELHNALSQVKSASSSGPKFQERALVWFKKSSEIIVAETFKIAITKALEAYFR